MQFRLDVLWSFPFLFFLLMNFPCLVNSTPLPETNSAVHHSKALAISTGRAGSSIFHRLLEVVQSHTWIFTWLHDSETGLGLSWGGFGFGDGSRDWNWGGTQLTVVVSVSYQIMLYIVAELILWHLVGIGS